MTPSTLAKLREVHRLLGEIIAAESPEDALNEDEIVFLRAGNAINAIKSVRHRLGLGLREAKVFVETEGVKHNLCRWDHLSGRYIYGEEK